MSGHPCEICLRWSECNGVAWGTPDCPTSPQNKTPVLPAYLDDREESGLIEED